MMLDKRISEKTKQKRYSNLQENERISKIESRGPPPPHTGKQEEVFGKKQETANIYRKGGGGCSAALSPSERRGQTRQLTRKGCCLEPGLQLMESPLEERAVNDLHNISCKWPGVIYPPWNLAYIYIICTTTHRRKTKRKDEISCMLYLSGRVNLVWLNGTPE